MKINIILFGYGRAGRVHYNYLKDNTKFNLTHIVEIIDISKEIDDKIKYVNFDEKSKLNFLITKTDAIIITTPTLNHYELIMLGLKNKKHVFVEKPITHNITQINECFELAEKNNLILLVGYNRRFDPMIKNIKSRIDAKEIGFVNYALSISRDYPFPKQSFLKVSSGIFHDCATHDIDYFNWILKDKPISVTVTCDDHNDIKDYNYNHVSINFKYSLGTIVCLNLSRVSSSYDQRCEFYGDKGEIINNEFDSDKKEKISFPERYKQAFINELDYFYQCIQEDLKPIITKEDCINNFIIAEACQEAVKHNKKITIKYGEGFRNYDNVSKRVYDNYFKARKFQTLDFVKQMHKKFSKFEVKMGIWEILEDLNNLVDVSDPDVSHPNLYHAVQTAEMMRKDDLPDWMQLMGLIHDMGKIMYKIGNDYDGTGKKEQWAMVGDTFIVGCKLPEGIIFPEFNEYNPDMKNDKYNTDLGIYKESCGLDQLICSWGHDEYLYRILTYPQNINFLPEEALYMARFHSLYAYHDKKEYYRFQSYKDKKMFKWLKLFNKYDLYSKSDEILDIDALKPYYIDLINKYFLDPFVYI